MFGLLNKDETAVIQVLVGAWNKFLLLPELHPWDRQEFMHAIHAAQLIVMARPVKQEQLEENT
jgi:hypothetical protein